MKRFVLFAALSLALIASGALADTVDQKVMVRGGWGTLHGQAINTAKADVETTYVLGGPDSFEGKFEDQFGNPDWQGWTSEDLTFSSDSFWQVSDFNAVNGVYSMWCGTDFNGDPGYGNGWNQNLVLTYTVPDPGANSTVQWSMTVQNDTEPAYDYTFLEVNKAGIWEVLQQYDGARILNPNETINFTPSDYTGSGGDQIQLRVRVNSDGGWSDEDGLWPTDGACQIDDILVTVDNGSGPVTVDDEDFEDQVSDNWIPVLDPGVGDYAALYTNLEDEDPCRTNFSAQAAFVDNGIVVPGTGGSLCTTWCYGPDGFIVNNTGGLMGPDFHIHNIIKSPVKPFPAGADAAYVTFDVYRHEELGAPGTWPGMFYEWFVRSVNTGDPADIESAAWQNRNFVQYGGPDYLRQREDVTDLLVQGRTHVQVGLTVYELGYNWGWIGTDGTPAPYFDNVAFVAYPFGGPGISTRDIDIANDSFPAAGDFDFTNLENNAIRFDMANNIAPNGQANDPGDSITVDIAAVRSGTQLVEYPKLVFRMKANPVFDGVRDLTGLNTVEIEPGIIEGWVYGDTTRNAQGAVIEDRWNFDLPDSGFFYPGDVIHYYIEAEDTDAGISTLPGDLDGFGNFDHDLSFDSDFIVRGLPTLFSASSGDHPSILFWNDFGDRGGENEWLFALQNLGFIEGVDYDLYYTNGPSSGVGNGLGGRATSALLDGYSTLLYTSGDLSTNLLANGDLENDPSQDLTVVTNWLNRGDKNAFMTGDDLVTGLLDAGALGQAFVNDYFNVNYVNNSVRSFIANQTAPLVKTIAGNGFIADVDEWIAYGGCLGINTFDAFEPNSGTTLIAEFTDPQGNGGAYPYAAATYYNNSSNNADVVLMAHDFMFLYNAPGWAPPAGFEGVAARAVVLDNILSVFGESPNPGGPGPVGVTPDAPLAVSNFPNPFNPQTTIKLNLPRAGEVSLKVFNVRGALVRTLVDGQMAAGEHSIIWDGKTDSGDQAASGVYFYETRANGEVKVNKMALVK